MATKIKTHSTLDLAQLMERSERRAILFSLLFPLLASALLFFNDHRQHKQVAYYFTEIIRYEIVKGSMRDATYQAQRMVMRNGPFFRIKYQDARELDVIDQTNGDVPPFLGNSIQQILRYDDGPEGKTVGTLTYYYSLENFAELSLVFFVASALAVSGFLIRQRKTISKKIEEQVRKEKTEAIARTINGIAHDLRAPLNMIEIFLSHVEAKYTQEYTSAKQSLTRIQAMIDSLRLGEIDQLVKPVMASLELTYIIDLLKNFAHQRGKTFAVEGFHEISLAIDQPKIERLVQNLVVNAIESSSNCVTLQFESNHTTFKISVTDDGEGVPEELALNLFQRGATSGKRGGTGLGLSYCKMVAEGHGGSIIYKRSSGLTIFTVYIPIHSEPFSQPSDLQNNSCTKIVIGIIIGNKALSDELKRRIRSQFQGVEVANTPDQALGSEIVFIDDLNVIDTLQNDNQSLIIVKNNDKIEALLSRLTSAITQITQRSGG